MTTTTTGTDSYFNGSVRSTNSNGVAGALAGNGTGENFNNTYWSDNVTAPPVGTGLTKSGQWTGCNQALSQEIFANGDVKYYQNGTINQVRADRAAAAEATARQAAFQAEGARFGSTAATGSDVSLSGATGPATAASMSAMRQLAKLGGVDDGLKQTEQTIRSDDTRLEKRRKAAIAAAARAANAPCAPSYRGTIRSIEVDGQRFELERDDTPSSGGSSGTPTSSGGAQ